MRKLLIALGLFVAVVAGASGSTSAGGWVVISLDSAPIFRAGVPTEIGFTMLRHGVTLENETDTNPVQVVATGSDGERTTFDVEQSGALGHHVATITLPAAGTYTWEFTGPFMPVDMGSFDVGSGSAGTAGDGSGDSPIWPIVQWSSAALALVMAALAGTDLVRSRRRAAAA